MINSHNIFIVGVKGVAMTNLAIMLKKIGKNTSGSDVKQEFPTDEILKKQAIKVVIGFSAKDLPDSTDIVIYSAAHDGFNNPQVKEAIKRGIKVISQTKVFDMLMEGYKNKIAVCGCHGKTTTTSLLAYSLLKLGIKPSYIVGATNFNNYFGSDINSNNNYFVVEADEYGVSPPLDKIPKFYHLNPNYIIATNIDFDHPDVYQNIKEIKDAFFHFFNKDCHIYACLDDVNLRNVLHKIPQNKFQTYGLNNASDLVISDVMNFEDHTSFKLSYLGADLGQFKISLFGIKNVSNAASVILALINFGFPIDKIKASIKDFTGAKRRLEKIININNILLFDDYAHHPEEIRATINAVRNRFPKRRLVIVFQPHTFSRTQSLLSKFSESLSLADLAYILPIFASARENDREFKISSKDIVSISNKTNMQSVANINDLIDKLKANLKPGDIVFTMGAGDVYKTQADIIDIIKHIT